MHFADQWWWLIAGLVLVIAEMLMPGLFLIWIGAAAILTGLIEVASGVSLPLELAIFAITSVGAIYGAKHWIRHIPAEPADPLLNDRAARLLGTAVTVTAPIAPEVAGRVRVGDGEWLARGCTAAAGERVRIAGIDGSCLIVEAL